MRHRLRTRLGVMAALSLLLLAGCGKPSSSESRLKNGWSVMSEPTGFTPVAGACHLANFAIVGTRGVYEEADCAIKHRTETVYVGDYPKPAAEAPAPPIEGSAGARAAYRICDEETTEFVGAPWRPG